MGTLLYVREGLRRGARTLGSSEVPPDCHPLMKASNGEKRSQGPSWEGGTALPWDC